MNFLNRFQPQLLGLIRIVFGYLFMLHGTTKLFQIPYIEKFANVPLMSIYGAAGVLELVGGLLLILGLLTRPTAFILSGQMAVAYFMSHAKADNFLMPILNGGELAVLYCFAFLYLAAAGGGAFALDNVLARKR